MYKIKQIPEEFIVEEISKVNLKEKGEFFYYRMKKKNYSTLRAAEHIAEKLGIPMKWVGFAGNKDKAAITSQLISIKNKKTDNINLRDIELEYLGCGTEPISLGELEGNQFVITIRNLTNDDIKKIKKLGEKIKFKNYFGEQRFSKNNAEIGKAILKKDFKKAALLASEGNESVKKYFDAKKTDYVGAIRTIQLKALKMYVHSYQSFLFNKIAAMLDSDENIKIPIIGFGTEIKNDSIGNKLKNIIEEEKINLRDFIIPSIPELSSDGGERELFSFADEFMVISEGEDELNTEMKKVIVSFKLKKGNYATIFIKEILS